MAASPSAGELRKRQVKGQAANKNTETSQSLPEIEEQKQYNGRLPAWFRHLTRTRRVAIINLILIILLALVLTNYFTGGKVFSKILEIDYIYGILEYIALQMTPTADFEWKNSSLISNEEFAQEFLRFSKESPTKNYIDNCFVAHTVIGHEQVCCEVKVKKGGNYACLPNLVMIGAQKGGTTALHSYLMLHPNMLPSKKKELHIYDFETMWRKGEVFNIHKNMILVDEDFTKEGISFETTPSYIAGPDTCERLSRALPGNSKFVAILRNPVDRVWSELQMKARRVESQDFFKEQFFNCAPMIKHCYDELPKMQPTKDAVQIKKQFKVVQECIKEVEDEICHKVASLPKLEVLWKSLVKFKEHKRQEFVDICLESDYESLEHMNQECFTKFKLLKEKNIKLPEDLEKEVTMMKQTCLDDLELREVLNKPKFIDPIKGIGYKENNCWFDHFRQSCKFCYDEKDSLSCLTKCANKAHNDFHVSQCSDWTHPFAEERLEFTETNLNWEEAKVGPFCHGPYCECFPPLKMPSDIQRGYFWRGLYDVHLNNCFVGMDPKRVHIIYNSELRNHPNETLNRMLDFADYPAFDFSNITADAASDIFEEAYPRFEEITGWSIDGTSAAKKMPEKVREMLKREYKPSVENLAKVLGRTPAFMTEFGDIL